MIRNKLYKRIIAGVISIVLPFQFLGSIPIGNLAYAGEVITDISCTDEEYIDDEHKNGTMPATGYYDIGYVAPVIPKVSTYDMPISRAVAIPEKYNSADKGYVTSIKNQQSLGTCWAFAAVAAMESYALSHGLVNSPTDIDLSEYALASLTFDDSSFVDNTGTTTSDVTSTTNIYNDMVNGGNDNYVFKTLGKWAGVMNEADAPYNANGNTKVTFDASKISYILTNQHFINMANVELIKKAIMENGAVTSHYNADSVYSNNSSDGKYRYYHYTYKEVATNHAIAIVGWDDTIAKENFTIVADGGMYTPSNDGAWLIKNSWGTWYGDGGYMWISYEDKSMINATACAYQIAPSSTYTYNYQHDGAVILGYSTTFGSISKYANVFDVAGSKAQDIKAVGIGIEDINREYSIQIYLNPEVDNPLSGTAMLSEAVTGSTTFAGYYTIELPEVITVNPGDSFSVVVEFDQTTRISSGSNVARYIGAGDSIADNECLDNQSYLIVGNTAKDTYDYFSEEDAGRINFCIKAFAVDNTNDIVASSITSVVSDGLSGITINWQRVNGVSAYELLRSTSLNDGYSVIYSGNATSYKDTEVSTNTTYYYKVRVYDGVEAIDSVVKSGKLIFTSTILRNISANYSGITVNWDSVSGVTGYNLYRSEDGANYTKIYTTTSGTSYTDTNVKYNKTYHYMVKLYIDRGGEGENTTEESVTSNTLSAKKVVDMPDSILSENTDKGKVMINWQNIDYADGYTIYRSFRYSDGRNLVEEMVTDVAAGVTNYLADVSDLELGQNVTFHISAYVMEDGVRVYSDKNYTIVFLNYMPIENIKWYVKDNIIYVKWDAYVSNMTVSRYLLYGYNNPADAMSSISRFTSNTYVSVPSMNVNNTYYITIQAQNAMYNTFTLTQTPRVKVGGELSNFALKNISNVQCKLGEEVELEAILESELENFDYTFQWYESAGDNTKGTKIEGATDRIYSPDTSNYGKRYYYCEVSAEYNGTKTAISNVVKVQNVKEMSESSVDAISNQIYTGNAITPDVKVTHNGTVLIKGKDYNVTYSNNINAGTATITITGIGGYTGTKLVTFSIIKNVPEKITSTVVNVDQNNNVVSKVTIGTKVSDILTGIDQKESVVVYYNNAPVSESAVVATGMKLAIVENGKIQKQYTIIVTGDTNSDGKINVADMMSVKSHILKKSTLTGELAKAADVNGDGKINVADFMSVKGYILKKNTVSGVIVK